MKTDKLIWWKDIYGTPPFMAMQNTLKSFGLHLQIVFDVSKKATDVHIVKISDQVPP